MFLLGLLQVMTTGPWSLLLILSNTVSKSLYFIINIEVHRNANEPEPLLSLALASGSMQGKSLLPQSITPGSIQLYFCIFGKRLTILHCHISLFLKQNETESSQLYFRCLASAASLDKSFFFFSSSFLLIVINILPPPPLLTLFFPCARDRYRWLAKIRHQVRSVSHKKSLGRVALPCPDSATQRSIPVAIDDTLVKSCQSSPASSLISAAAVRPVCVRGRAPHNSWLTDAGSATSRRTKAKKGVDGAALQREGARSHIPTEESTGSLLVFLNARGFDVRVPRLRSCRWHQAKLASKLPSLNVYRVAFDALGPLAAFLLGGRK